MKWILIIIMFNDGLHYAQSQPSMYDDYNTCKVASVEVKKVLMETRPTLDAHVMTFCASLPKPV